MRGCIKPMSFRPIVLEDKKINFIEFNLKRNIVRCINRTNNDSEPFVTLGLSADCQNQYTAS